MERGAREKQKKYKNKTLHNLYFSLELTLCVGGEVVKYLQKELIFREFHRTQSGINSECSGKAMQPSTAE